MPPLPVVPNTAQVRCFGHIASHEWQNVLHFTWTTGTMNVTAAELMAQTAFDNLYGVIYGSSSDWISSDCYLDKVTVTDLSSASGAFGVYDNGATPINGNASQQCHAQSSMVISNLIDRRFRGGHGRTYFVGFSDDNNQDGRTWKATAVTALQTNWDNGIAVVEGASYAVISGVQQSIVSYYDRALNPVPPYRRTTPIVDIVTARRYSNVLRSQRRRVRNTPTPT